MTDKKDWKHCHFTESMNSKRRSLYWAHQNESEPCMSIICDDLNDGIPIDQIWRKEYSCGKKIRIGQ